MTNRSDEEQAEMSTTKQMTDGEVEESMDMSMGGWRVAITDLGMGKPEYMARLLRERQRVPRQAREFLARVITGEVKLPRKRDRVAVSTFANMAIRGEVIRYTRTPDRRERIRRKKSAIFDLAKEYDLAPETVRYYFKRHMADYKRQVEEMRAEGYQVCWLIP